MKIGLSLVVLLSLVACGRDPASTAAKPAGSPAARAASAGEESVAAVPQGGSSRAVTLRFVLEDKPRVGATSHLRLEFSAAAPQAGVTFRIEGEELGFDAGTAPQAIDVTEAGTTRTVAFTPRSPGLTAATVRLKGSGGEAAEVLYDIPVLVEPAG